MLSECENDIAEPEDGWLEKEHFINPGIEEDGLLLLWSKQVHESNLDCSKVETLRA